MTSLPSMRCSVPVQWDRTCITNTPMKERPQTRRVFPSGHGSVPRDNLRHHRLPGTGHAGRQGTRWVLDGRGPTRSEKPWARRSRPSWTRSEKNSWRVVSPRVTTRNSARNCGTPSRPFAGYGFNKSHSAAYGYVAYQTAWLKANYPPRVHGGVAHVDPSETRTGRPFLNECRSTGIKVLVPDVNRSDMDFTVRDGAITFGLSAIRNVGEGVVEKVLRTTPPGRAFDSFQDFVNRVDASALNKRTIESLIKAGAFDTFGPARRGLLSSTSRSSTQPSAGDVTRTWASTACSALRMAARSPKRSRFAGT